MMTIKQLHKILSLTWVFVMMGLPLLPQAQQLYDPPKNEIELFYHNNYFFDDTRKKSNWLTFDMLTFGIQYTRHIEGDHSIRAGALFFFKDYDFANYNKLYTGATLNRLYGVFSVDYLFQVMRTKYFRALAVGGICYRHGGESIWLDQYGFETIIGGFDLNDVGITIGAKMELLTPKGFVLSLEPQYTRYIIRPGRRITYGNLDRKSTPNTATIKLGMGYWF